MPRSAVIVTASAFLGIIVALGAVQMRSTNDAKRPSVGSIGAPPEASQQIMNADGAAPTAASEPPTATIASEAPTSADDMERWITDTTSTDAGLRATAIAALADAPKAKAVPALEHVLEVGEPGRDRQIALRSLHKLALREGDDDGKIRDILRGAVYHGDDEDVSESARAFLEDIESEFASRSTTE